MNSLNGGQGIRIHFGLGNSSREDYYYVKTDDTRATSQNGLRIGGDAKNDIWSTGGYPSAPGNLNGCCGGGFASPAAVVQTSQGQGFMFGYNWDGAQKSDSALLAARYLAGRYGASGDTLSALAAKVNLGTQSRVGIEFANLTAAGNEYTVICLGTDEAYYMGSSASAKTAAGQRNVIKSFAGTEADLVSAVNRSSINYWAMLSAGHVYVFAKQGGDKNSLEAGEIGSLAADLSSISFINVETGITNKSGAHFTLGGRDWGRMEYFQSYPGATYSVAMLGKDTGNEMDIRIANNSEVSAGILGFTAGNKIIVSLSRNKFTEVQNASDSLYPGGNVRTQEAGQLALDAVNNAIIRKDVIRANLGAVANRLEATIENLTIQAENLQASESRISDADIAMEMTEFTKNNILAQAATSMLAQANSLNSLALTLLR
jgi:flagellin